jgi:hypothetical protein
VANFGEQTERYDGFDAGLHARFGGGGLLQGGVSVGRQVSDNCYLNSRPDLTPAPATLVSAIPAGTPRTDAYCHVSPPWSAGTQVKFNGVYPLAWGIEPSFTYQNLPGAFVAATYNAPNAVIAQGLRRNLAACPAAGTCTATAPVELIPASSVFLDRVSLLDLRLTKVVRVGNARVKGMLDIYNTFNTNTVLNVIGTFGPTWMRPSSFVGGRLFKFAVQADF